MTPSPIADYHAITAEELIDALADSGHTQIGFVVGNDLGTAKAQVVSVELHLSNGRIIEIAADADSDNQPQLEITELKEVRR